MIGSTASQEPFRACDSFTSCICCDRMVPGRLQDQSSSTCSSDAQGSPMAIIRPQATQYKMTRSARHLSRICRRLVGSAFSSGYHVSSSALQVPINLPTSAFRCLRIVKTDEKAANIFGWRKKQSYHIRCPSPIVMSNLRDSVSIHSRARKLSTIQVLALHPVIRLGKLRLESDLCKAGGQR